MRCFYHIFIFLYGSAITIFSFFNTKAKLWKRGRINIFNSLEEFKTKNQKPLIWIHCASLGEFEQGRPIIESIKHQQPNYSVLITFFSPSGYEIRKNYALADFVCYLPLDTPSNAKKFIDIIHPEIALFVKYEYWFNYMNVLAKKEIPLYVVSAIFRPNQHFFKWWGKWFAKQLQTVNHFYVQNEISCQLLNSINLSNYTLTGDTRFDRVFEISKQKRNFELIDQFCISKNKTWVLGSSWHPDEMLFPALLKHDPSLKIIIVPHEIDKSHLSQIESDFSTFGVVFYSQTTAEEVANARVMIVDTIGMLSQLYRYGCVAYVGGGFGNGIHNILEAAVYEIPVIFGPKYQKFEEAVTLINLGGAFSIENEQELLTVFEKLSNDADFYHITAAVSSTFVQQNLGATQKIMLSLFEKQLSTPSILEE